MQPVIGKLFLHDHDEMRNLCRRQVSFVLSYKTFGLVVSK